MAKMHGEHLFTGIIYVRGAPLIHVAPTTEIEHPWRKCKRSVIIRLWKGKALVLGFWRDNDKPWHDSLLEAVNGRIMDDQERQEIKGLTGESEN